VEVNDFKNGNVCMGLNLKMCSNNSFACRKSEWPFSGLQIAFRGNVWTVLHF